MKRSEVRMTRRTVLRGAAAGGVMGLVHGWRPAEAAEDTSPEMKPGTAILFQGDSITDAGRKRAAKGPNDLAGLGHGYAAMAAGALLGQYPEAGLRIYNRGISGHKVPDLDARWAKDAVELKPDILSILIGVNDIWHKLNGNYDGTVKDYETGYRALLKRTADEIPGVRIVMCEPFVLRCGAVNETWFPEFDQRLEVARALARELKLALVPFQRVFDQASQNVPPAFWAGDGVHPTIAGHALMARTWRDTVGL